jgi:hypothetical protein
MTLTISDTTMTSDRTAHTARHEPSRNRWAVSWLPGRILDRNTAITAMILADIVGEEHIHEGHRLWPHLESWAGELGLTAPEAITQAAQPSSNPGREHEQPGGQLDREAAD